MLLQVEGEEEGIYYYSDNGLRSKPSISMSTSQIAEANFKVI